VRETDLGTPEGRLIFEVAFLADWDGGGPEHNTALESAAVSLRNGQPLNWEALVNWSKLPCIRTDLDALPAPQSSPTSILPEAESPEEDGRNVLLWDGERWNLTFQNKATLVHESVGLFYLSVLVGTPGKSIAAAELRKSYGIWQADPTSVLRRSAAVSSVVSSAHREDVDESGDSLQAAGSDLGDVLDSTALADYRSRIATLPSEIGELRSQGMLSQAAERERDLAELERTVERSLDLGGQPKKVSAAHKKDRAAVCKAIRRTLNELKKSSPALFHHFRSSLSLGSRCCYSPEPATSWN
jgi:hypothetical protein